ncbi:MAG: 3-dehydroquinate synthase [Spirochaetia bacterium]|nr:3-dehydroquinate synthase [Spirochaetia bacterium]
MHTLDSSKINIQISSEKEYDVFVGRGFHDSLFQKLASLQASSYFIISQKGLGPFFFNDFLDQLKKHLEIPDKQICMIEGGEENKHLSRLGPVYNQIIDAGADRKSVILAVGGGVVGDFAGFVAATIQRGVRFVQIPSTLLSAVDASVGGKVAINVDRGKNMVGAFHQPELVYFNLDLLKTLPEKEWNCGLAEMVKHGFLDSQGQIYPFLLENTVHLRDPASDLLKKAVMDSIAFKASVVARDEKESGLRAILNLGHTTAHALESFTEYSRFSHGEAVSRGLVTMMYLSEEILGLPEADTKSMIDLMQKLNLPLDTAGISADDLLEHLKYDKKTVGGIPQFVLLRRRGDYEYGVKVSEESFQKAWNRQKAQFG